MVELNFKIVVGPGDWGSPLNDEPTFDTLEEAQEGAREYLAEQRKMGETALPFRARIEETRADGTVVTHPVG